MQRKRVQKKDQKVDPLEVKSGPPWRIQFGLFIAVNLLKRSFQVQADLTRQLQLESSTGEAHFCALAFSYVLRTKKGPLLCNIVLLQFP